MAAGLSIDPTAYKKDYKHQNGASKDWRTQLYDRFRGRLMVPIKNENGVVIGFGGRVLDGMDNSEDIELYSDSNGVDGVMNSESGGPQSLANLAAQSSSSGRGRFTQPLVQSKQFPSSASSSTNQAKYLNSPESVVFKKGSTLFGLDLAKKHIIRQLGSFI